MTIKPPGRTAVALASLAAVMALGGCAMFDSTPPRDYRTVQASTTRDTEAAKKHHGKALAILDNCGRPYCCECVERALCNPCRAERHLQDALVADVRFGPAHNTLGMLYYTQHKLYLAAWEFEYASRLMPDRPEPLNNLGLVYEETGKFNRALTFYQEAVELAPNNAEYLGNLARVHLRSGTPLDEARYWLEQVVMHDSRGDWVAWAKDKLGENPPRYDRASPAVFEESNNEPGPPPEMLPPPEATGPELIDPTINPALELVNPLSQVSFERKVDGRIDWIAPRKFEVQGESRELPQ